MSELLLASKLDYCLCNNESLQRLSYLIAKIIQSTQVNDILEQSLFLPKLFSSEILNKTDKKTIWQIYSLFSASNMYWKNTVLSHCVAMAVLDSQIKDDIRALFWHSFMRKAPRISYASFRFFKYLRARLYKNGINIEDVISFLDNTIILSVGEFKPLPSLLDAICEDNPSRFAIYRDLDDEKISRNMLAYLLVKNAAKCFNILLEMYPQIVCRVRKKEEWLWTVCMNCSVKTAVSIIRAFEKKYPGICSETHDPWNHNLLWLTTFNESKDIFVLQKDLIDLGCDPDEKNDLGFSFKLIMENTPEKWKKEVKQ